ncbi:hypothetical protein [Parabacteroides chinchillae]
MKLLMSSKKRNSSAIGIQGHYYNNNNDACFQEITPIAPISFKASKGNQLFITLTIGDTWCDKAGDGAWFAIKVNNNIVARGLYTCGMDGQRVPITLQTMVNITSPEENITVKAMWCNNGGTDNRYCSIGGFSEAVLTVLVNDWSQLESMISSKLEEITKFIPKGH